MIEVMKPQVVRPDVALYTDIVYSNVYSNFMQEIIPLRIQLLRPFYELRNWKKSPLLIWLSGGAWRSCTPYRRIPELSYYAYHGYAVASVRYRVSSEGLFPAAIEDVKAAIRYMRAHADQYGIDPDRIAIMGDSAGGHLSALAGVTIGHMEFNNGEWADYSDEVRAVVDWYGPSDLTEVDRDIQQTPNPPALSVASLLVGGPTENEQEKCRMASPVSYVTGKEPPFLILHGTEDSMVPIKQSLLLYEALNEKGADVTLCKLEGAEHDHIMFSQPEVQERILHFLNEHV